MEFFASSAGSDSKSSKAADTEFESFSRLEVELEACRFLRAVLKK